MKAKSLLCLALGTAGLLFILAKQASSNQPPAQAVVQLTSLQVPVSVPVVSPEKLLAAQQLAHEQAHYEALKDYLLSAMREWAPAQNQPEQDTSNYEDIAGDIAAGMLLKEEPAFWKDDANKGKSALLVTSIGYWEGHYWKFVDDGRCNSSKWLKSREGARLTGPKATCDGGFAYSIFQIHADRGGIALDYDEDDDGNLIGTGYGYHYDRPSAPFVTGRDMIFDRKRAVSAVIHMLRPAVAAGHNLCEYTGESRPCKKGKERLDWALKWWTSHPFQFT
jgi:hypothetical protein